MAACADQEERLDLHAAGALDAVETVPLLEHLASCPGCREAFEATRAVLSLAALPPPSATERTLQEALPRRTLAAWHRERTRQSMRWRTLGSVAAVAAVVAVMVLGPWRAARWTAETPDGAAARPAAVEDGGATETRQTLADFEAWAGLEPLEATDMAASEDDAMFDDLDAWDDFEQGEML